VCDLFFALFWQNDFFRNLLRDVFLTAGEGSWVAEAHGPQVDETLIELLKEVISWKVGHARQSSH